LRILALDFGEKRIGVALSDPTGLLASPITTIAVGEDESGLEGILSIAAENEVGEIVVGMPFSLSGRKGPQARLVRDFIGLLSEQTDIPITPVDERLSSVEAERRMRESGGEPWKNKARVDSVAAAIILQSYLDSRKLRSST
jgi:putative Holliday junction resolvase